MKFGTLIADPPWPYGKARHSKAEGGASGYVSQADKVQYETMSMQDLKALPVESVSAENSVLLLWTTPAFSATGDATALCEAWGFRPVTHTYWVKTTNDGGNFAYGVGYWFRGCVEPVLVGVRGRAYRTNERGAFRSPLRGHSRKPDDLHLLAEEHFPGPRLELFARRRFGAWTTIGGELTGNDIAEDLEILSGR